ncbi:hypothetical protein [Corynebacterium lowii]|uniref:Uncharacterized protein n=1 Tax=Corynebacterium lowii TaxID=1544413 RepID=A0A0Q0YH20_9CORY|nr:hypothetical protein [Corynebacterium lowii]KQB85932.1 hypothetical protein Clow_01674 [Corynebacterium lowii]MDP9850640.1 hypothetical protein [Corynebacterium lowii]
MRAQRFLATAGAAALLTVGAVVPAQAEDGTENATQPAAEQSSPSTDSTNTEAPAQGPQEALSPVEQAEFDLRKQELSTEQAKLSIDSVKSVLKIALFFSGVGIPLALAL